MTQQAHINKYVLRPKIPSFIDHSPQQRGNQCMWQFPRSMINHKHLGSDVSVLCWPRPALPHPGHQPRESLKVAAESLVITPLATFQREDARNKIVNSVLWVVRINQASRGGRTSGSRCIGSFRGHFIVKKDGFFTKAMLILRIAMKIVLLDYSLFVFHNSYMTWRHVPTLLAHRTVALVLSLLLNNTSHHIISFTLTEHLTYRTIVVAMNNSELFSRECNSHIRNLMTWQSKTYTWTETSFYSSGCTNYSNVKRYKSGSYLTWLTMQICWFIPAWGIW